MARIEFTRPTMVLALTRQKNHCASCGTIIYALGESGHAKHRFGEAAHAHHVEHAKFKGGNSVENCVIICQSCHYSAHEGGNYKHGTVEGEPEDFQFYNGCLLANCREHRTLQKGA